MNEQNITFDYIYKQLYDPVCKYCAVKLGDLAYCAEEAADDAFLLLYQKWDEIENRTKNSYYSWLLKTADFKVKELLRKERRNPQTIAIDDGENGTLNENSICSAVNEIDELIENNSYLNYLEIINDALDDKERQIFDCIAIQNYTVNKSAEICGMKPGALYMRWMRMKKKLSKLILPYLKDQL